MKAPSENTLIALRRISDDKEYPLIVEWVKECVEGQRTAAVEAGPDIAVRQAQGAAKAFGHLLLYVQNPLESLHKLRETQKNLGFNHDQA